MTASPAGQGRRPAARRAAEPPTGFGAAADRGRSGARDDDQGDGQHGGGGQHGGHGQHGGDGQHGGHGDAVRQSDVVDAVLAASRALVAVAARSMAQIAEDVTLPQYRALVVLATHGPQRVADLAGALGIEPSTATRMCDRLVRKDLACRQHDEATDRRTVRVTLSPAGEQLVADVTRRRLKEISSVVELLPPTDVATVVAGMEAFASAAAATGNQGAAVGTSTGTPQRDASGWALGWDDAVQVGPRPPEKAPGRHGQHGPSHTLRRPGQDTPGATGRGGATPGG